MPSTCVVPNCLMSLSGGRRGSCFKVPKDENLREQWRVAIPGIDDLRTYQVVCDKHFQEELIIRNYVKYDNSGNILIQVPLKRHRLRAGAVPTIFKTNDSSRERSPPKFQKCIDDITLDHCYAAKQISESTQNVDQPDIRVTNSAENSKADPDSKVQAEISCNVISSFKTHTTDHDKSTKLAEGSKADFDSEMQEETFCDAISSFKTDTTDCDKNATHLPYTLECDRLKEEELEGNPLDISKSEAQSNYSCDVDMNSSCPSTTNEIEWVLDDSIPESEEMRDDVKSEIPVQTHSDTLNEIRMSSTQFCGNATFNFSTPCIDTVEHDVEAKVPKPWGLQKSIIGQEEVLIFTYVVESTDNGTPTHIFEKSVLIKSSREIIYEVFSRRVNVLEAKIPKILSDFKMLPEILKKFKDFKVCKGVSGIIPNSFQTSVSRTVTGMDVRHKDCSLLSYNCERCRSCKIYSTSIAKSLKQSKQKENFASPFRNATERQKLKALRNKLRLQREQSKRLRRKVSLLTDSIAEQQKVAGLYTDCLDGLESVPDNMKVVIKEIINAAKKKDRRGRRYTDEFMMLCMSMIIRSKGYYNFLRDNDIIPLPSTQTVRQYMTLIGRKCGFD